MRDPGEGVTPDGHITTGVGRERITASFLPIVNVAVALFEAHAADPDAELLLYGSVATGQAVPGASDVDLIAAGVDREIAARLSRDLSKRFEGACRSVELACMTLRSHLGKGDEAYGNRVFLRHYCLPLAGPDRLRGTAAFRADARAARGFNGDIATAPNGWRAAPQTAALGPRVARKSLVAAAGLHSVLTATWTTDREQGAAAWRDRRPDLSDEVQVLQQWANGRQATPEQVRDVLRASGPIEELTREYAAVVGLWNVQ
jgi:hypothetical protein